jgi:predicted MPP superfamily phosphohydrolase
MSVSKWAAAVLLLLILDIFAIEPYWIKTTTYRLQCRRLKRDLRVLLLSDFQLRTNAGYREREVLKRITTLQFDLIAVTGDVFDASVAMEPAIELLKTLSKRAPTYVVPGNWEHWSGADLSEYARRLQQTSVKLLVNASDTFMWHDQPIAIVGVDDPSIAQDDLIGALKNVDRSIPTILLAHAPVIFRNPAHDQIDLTLAGHTHGGQVRLPLLGPLWLPPGCDHYVYGVYKTGTKGMVVTSGVGTSVLPVRFLCRPEIVLIELTKGD